MSRRVFLAAAAASLPILGLGCLRLPAGDRRLDELYALIRELPISRSHAAKVGARYLQTIAEGGRRRELAESLLPCLDPAGRTAAGGNGLLAALGGQIRRDFGADRTVDLEGWVVSETEARLYALIHLLDSAGPA